jgi:Domain found in Dishevelled, Egl-10, and Pleckstrin (DEP)
MLILTSDRVQYCQATRSIEGKLEILPSLIYQAQLFDKCRSYPLDRKQEAIRCCRQKFLENKEEILFLIIEEPDGFTIWRQDDSLKYAGSYQKIDFVASVDLKQLVAKMRQSRHLTIKDRRYNLRVYPKCFVGREAVSWMMKTLEIDPETAIALGQRLIDENWIHHVTDDQPFRDEYLFYRFFSDD